MARRKVRNFKSKEYFKNLIATYYAEHYAEVIADLVTELGCSSFAELQQDEHNMRFGFDCGWILLYPKDKAMYHEWELDNGKYDVPIFCRTPWNCQSTTCQRIMVEKAVKDLGLEDVFRISTRLD